MSVFLVGAVMVLVLYFATAPAHETVVLLPGPDGRVGTVIVQRGSERTVLDRAYAVTRAHGAREVEAGRLDSEQVRREFGEVLSALPARPMSYVLYFNAGLDELTDESKVAMQRLLEELRSRPHADIVVIGHTDRVATDEWNDALSLQRAERIKAQIVGQGIAADRVRTAGRGEREPLVPTADGVEEARNRRVEVSIR